MSFSLNKNQSYIMGILNVTPDSFSDGGDFFDTSIAIKYVEQMILDGVNIIDIGGESSRPNAEAVSIEEEWERIGSIIKEIKQNFNIPISVDTYKSEIALKSLDLGVEIINDISGFSSDAMRDVVSRFDATAIIMHMKGTPRNMQNDPSYDDVITEIFSFLKDRVSLCNDSGIKNCIIDPGIGFGKNLEHNVEIMRNLKTFSDIAPVLLGASRKSFLGLITGIKNAKDRDVATHVTTLIGLQNGVNLFRVHDVKGTKNVIDMYEKLSISN